MLGQRAGHLPFARNAAFVGDIDHRVAAQIGKMRRLSVCADITGAGAEHAVDFADLDHVQRAVGGIADAYGDIDRFFGHVRHAVDQQQADVKPGMQPEQFDHDRQDVQPAEHHRRGHG